MSDGGAAEGRVLVVDDEEGVRVILRTVLETRDLEVVEAGNAAGALAEVAPGRFDMAVVDKNLPDGSGLTLLSDLKAIDPDLEVAIVTGYGSLDAAIEALRFGAGDFLLKPFEDVATLGDQLVAALGRGKAARSRTAALEAARDAAEAREADRRALLADVAHDLRTPLTTLQGYLDLLERPVSEETLARYLAVMRSQTRRLARLTEDVGYLVRASEGRTHLKRLAWPVEEVVDGALDEMRPLYDQAGVRLGRRVVDALGEVDCDRDRILQVLTNLMGNALKFAPEGSEVTVTAEPWHGSVVLSVLDQGPGVPPEARQRVFERWHTKDPSGRGQGLGLAICKAIVDAHGGRIWVDEADGGGAAFCFLLPGVARDTRSAR
jgi:signal transduction histidine kinase